MKGPLLQMVQPILQIIAANKAVRVYIRRSNAIAMQGIPMNEYLMRPVAALPSQSISQDCGEDIRLPEAAGSEFNRSLTPCALCLTPQGHVVELMLFLERPAGRRDRAIHAAVSIRCIYNNVYIYMICIFIYLSMIH